MNNEENKTNINRLIINYATLIGNYYKIRIKRNLIIAFFL